MDPNVRAQIDADLVRLADGDRSAFDPTFTALWPLVVALSTRLLGSRADAEDAAQEAMFKVFDRINELDVARSGVSWALGITAWECRAMRSRRVRRREDAGDAAVEPVSGAPSPESEVMTRELLIASREVLGELSPADQETLRATFDELPNATGPTFRKRRERALARLRHAWRRLYGTS